MSQRRTNYLSAQDAVAYCDLQRVFRLELLAHYELPKDLPRQILTLMMALNDQDERLERSARHAFALSVAGVMVVMVVWNLMLFFY